MRSRRNSGSTSTGICSSTRRRFDDAFCSSPRRLAFCSSTRRRDDDATTTRRLDARRWRWTTSTDRQLSHGLGASELGRLPGLDSPGARASKRGYVPLEGYWQDTCPCLPRLSLAERSWWAGKSQDVRRNKHAPQDDHSYAAPLGLRVLRWQFPMAIRREQDHRRGEKRGRTGALFCDSAGSFHSGLRSLRGRTTDS